ncbi:hypothetical protein ACGP04_04930 [Piscirickettsia salmonis]
MLGDFASLDVQNTYRGSDAYDIKKQNICAQNQLIDKLFGLAA